MRERERESVCVCVSLSLCVSVCVCLCVSPVDGRRALKSVSSCEVIFSHSSPALETLDQYSLIRCSYPFSSRNIGLLLFIYSFISSQSLER